MLTMSLPDTLATLLATFAPCFTAPTFGTFRALVAGYLAQPDRRTVTGMLTGARLAGQVNGRVVVVVGGSPDRIRTGATALRGSRR
jgi:hypothetical protein